MMPEAPENPKWTKTKEIFQKTQITGGSVFQGIFGDHLQRFTPLVAREMGFFRKGTPLEISGNIQFPKDFSRKIVILVHGLVSDETMWEIPDEKEDYGTLLEKEFRVYPLYVRYNSGLHISDNGKALDFLLEAFLKEFGKQIQELVLLTHSMGGLVARSACYYAEKRKAKWLPKVSQIYFLGSPHHGAPLEKFGNTVTTVLKKIPNPFTYLTQKAINLRSAGIKDLRYGLLVEEDWKGKDPDAYLPGEKTHVPLLPHIQYFVISGTLLENPNHFLSEVLGDAMVGKWSSKGKSGKEEYNLSFLEENMKEMPGISHIRLMHDKRVYEQIKTWFDKGSPKTKKRFWE